MKNILTFLCLLIGSTSYAQQLETIVQDIAYYSKVDDEHIGLATNAEQPISPGYSLYEKMKRVATTEQLVKLTKHPNMVVATYAAWGLIDMEYSDFPNVFIYFLDNDRSVRFQHGCSPRSEFASVLLLYRLRPKSDPRSKKLIRTLDSLVLYTHHTDIPVLEHSLLYGTQPTEFLPRIEFLAFEWNRIHALFYLYDYPKPKPEYKDKLKTGFVKYFNRATHAKNDLQTEDKLIKILLSYRDPLINATIVDRLKREKFWKQPGSKIPELLAEYGVRI